MLIVFSGLPGTGKTTIARALATKLGAIYLRIDVIEQAIRNAKVLAGDVGPAGYAVAQALAAANLAIGKTVVADCVNPVAESRAGWWETADSVESSLMDVEVVCSDIHEHRRRVETRTPDIEGLILPTWESVLKHDYESWQAERLVLDTFVLSPQEALRAIEQRLKAPSEKTD